MKMAIELELARLPKCEAFRKRVCHLDEDDKPKLCSRKAKFKINGKNLCRNHAQLEALNILLQQETK